MSSGRRCAACDIETLIGLLAVTGMRPGEALALTATTSIFTHGVLHVRAGKQKKQREVPLHGPTISALRDYARLRDARFPDALNAGVLHLRHEADGGREELNRTFTKLIREVGLEGRGARGQTAPARSPARVCGAHAAGLASQAARTSTGGCRCSPPSSATSIPRRRIGIWRRSPSCWR